MLVKRIINDVEFEVNVKKSRSIICSKDISNIIHGDLNEFIEYIYQRKKVYIPLAMTLEITNKCNFNCQFCYINEDGKKKYDIEINKLKSDIDFLVNKGLLVVYLTGGEVLTYPHFEELYRYLKYKGIFVVLLTNLSLLNEKHIKLFKELPPYRITVSIYGMTEEQFQNVTQTQYDYKKILKNIMLLKDNGILVTCQTPLNKLTVSDFELIKHWCEEKHIRYSHSTELSDTYSGKSLKQLKIDDDIFNEEKIEKKILKSKINFGYKYHFDCRAGKHTFAISYEYKLRPCFMFFGEDAKTFDANNSMESALNEMTQYINEMRRKKVAGCKGCIAHNICTECVFSQQKVKNLDEYMNEKCEMTYKKLLDLKIID